MNVRIVILLFLVAVSASVAWWLNSQSQKPSSKTAEEAPLLGPLSSAVKNIQRIKIENHDGVLFSAVKNKGQWVATHLDTMMTFPVDTTQLASLVDKLGDARIVEEKTARPSLYHRLGVESIAQDDAQSVLIELGTPDDVFSLLVGQTADSGRGSYVRQPTQAFSLLIDQSLSLPVSSSDWLSQDVLPFKAVDLQQIAVSLNGEPALRLIPSAQGNATWTLADLKSDEHLRFPSVIDQTVGNMLSFTYESVSPYVENQWGTRSLLGNIMFTLQDDSQIFMEISTADNQGMYAVRFYMPDSSQWQSEWVFFINEFQAQRLLVNKADFLAAGE